VFHCPPPALSGDKMYNEIKLMRDAEAILEVLTTSMDLPDVDARFLLECHGEDVMPVPGGVSYHEAAKTLLSMAVEWGEDDYDEFLGNEP